MCGRSAEKTIINVLPPVPVLSDAPAKLGLHLLKPRLVKSHPTVIVPLDDRVLFVSSLNCSEFSIRLSEVAQTLDAISGIQFLASSRGLDERWPLGTV